MRCPASPTPVASSGPCSRGLQTGKTSNAPVAQMLISTFATVCLLYSSYCGSSSLFCASQWLLKLSNGKKYICRVKLHKLNLDCVHFLNFLVSKDISNYPTL